MAKNKFIGTGVAIVTPFRKGGSIDFNAFKKHIEYLIKNNINYLVVLGTTGETATLSKDEQRAIIDFAIETVDKKIPIVMGIGGNNTQNIIDTIKNNDLNNIDAILSVAPYYNKPSQKGLYYHYKDIASASPVPVILYNVPGRTSVNINAETTLKLATEVDNIIAIKEASGNLSQIMKIIRDKPKDFLVISGDDALTLPMISLGGNGVISVTANAFPSQFSNMVNLALNGNYSEARKIHYQLIEIINTLFVDGNPSGIKAALNILDIIPNNLRLPLTTVSKATYIKLTKLIEEFNR
ncbi:MAG: 4-hydroxy-tetrahydrodipicolinate synthase [Bacteroidales bacterium]|nr:4-hydroxy-tetrahydrodipicolinate synthase [Bacteroidales bacterium]